MRMSMSTRSRPVKLFLVALALGLILLAGYWYLSDTEDDKRRLNTFNFEGLRQQHYKFRLDDETHYRILNRQRDSRRKSYVDSRELTLTTSSSKRKNKKHKYEKYNKLPEDISDPNKNLNKEIGVSVQKGALNAFTESILPIGDLWTLLDIISFKNALHTQDKRQPFYDWLNKTFVKDYTIETQHLPDAQLFPHLANGFLGYHVYSNQIFVNGVYQTKQHVRVAVPNYVFQNITVFSLRHRDSIIRKHSFLVPFGIFQQTLKSLDTLIEQRVYAHAAIPSVFVHEVDIVRYSSSSQTDFAFSLEFTRFAFFSYPVDITFTIRQSHSKRFEAFLGPNVEIREGRCRDEAVGDCQVFIVMDIVRKVLSFGRMTERTKLTFVQAVARTLPEAVAAYKTAKQLQKHDLLIVAHMAAWRKTWSSGSFSSLGDTHFNYQFLTAQYYLFSQFVFKQAVQNYTFQGLTFFGIANPNARVTYDQDLWATPYLSLLNPEFARTILDFRYNQLPLAKILANHSHRPGARFPPEATLIGSPIEPPVFSDWLVDDHVTGDVSVSLAHYLYATNDIDSFRQKYWVLLVEIAKYWDSRLQATKDKNKYFLRPSERGKPYPSTFTIVAAKRALELPYQLIKFMNGKDYKINEDTFVMRSYQHAKKLQVPFVKGAFHSEYTNSKRSYQKSVRFDPVMLSHPMGYTDHGEIIEKDLVTYQQLSTQILNTPATLFSAHCIGWLSLANHENANIQTAWASFKNQLSFSANRFKVWTLFNTGGDTNVIAYIGPFLHSVIYGYLRFNVTSEHMSLNPIMIPKVHEYKIHAIHYFSNALSISIQFNQIKIKVIAHSKDTPILKVTSLMNSDVTVLSEFNHEYVFKNEKLFISVKGLEVWKEDESVLKVQDEDPSGDVINLVHKHYSSFETETGQYLDSDSRAELDKIVDANMKGLLVHDTGEVMPHRQTAVKPVLVTTVRPKTKLSPTLPKVVEGSESDDEAVMRRFLRRKSQ